MARPRAVSQSDMNRALDCLARAGIIIEEVIIEPGRVRLVPREGIRPQTVNDLQPKQWPTD